MLTVLMQPLKLCLSREFKEGREIPRFQKLRHFGPFFEMKDTYACFEFIGCTSFIDQSLNPLTYLLHE